jgi:hypothetical protein
LLWISNIYFAILGLFVIIIAGYIFLFIYIKFGWIISGIVHMGADIAVVIILFIIIDL